MLAYISVKQMGEEHDEEELYCRVDPNVHSCHCNDVYIVGSIITPESSLQLYMWCCSFWMPLLIPMLVVVNDEKSPRIHEKGSDIASAAMPSWATCQYHKYSTVPERIISKLTMSICLLINF